MQFVARRGCSYICLHQARPLRPEFSRRYFKSYATNQKSIMHLRFLPSPDAAETPVLHLCRSMLVLLLALAGTAVAQTDAPSPGTTAIASSIAATIAPPPMAVVRALRIPLTIDYLALSAALRQQLYTDNGRAPIWNGSDRCQYFYAENPRFARAGNNLKLETEGTLMIGLLVGSNASARFNGKASSRSTPRRMSRRRRNSSFTSATSTSTMCIIRRPCWSAKGSISLSQYYIPFLETFTFDLSPGFRPIPGAGESRCSTRGHRASRPDPRDA